jgi:hypothetical protein
MVAVLLVACSPNATETAVSSPSPSADLDALADAYLEIADQANAAACDFVQARRGAPSDLELIQTRAEGLAEAVRVVIDDLRELDFPPELQQQVDEYVASRERVEVALRAVGAASDSESMTSALEELDEASAGGAAMTNLIRAELGLPDAQTSEACSG